jgi:hypothetical protein
VAAAEERDGANVCVKCVAKEWGKMEKIEKTGMMEAE